MQEKLEQTKKTSRKSRSQTRRMEYTDPQPIKATRGRKGLAMRQDPPSGRSPAFDARHPGRASQMSAETRKRTRSSSSTKGKEHPKGEEGPSPPAGMKRTRNISFWDSAPAIKMAEEVVETAEDDTSEEADRPVQRAFTEVEQALRYYAQTKKKSKTNYERLIEEFEGLNLSKVKGTDNKLNNIFGKSRHTPIALRAGH